MESWVEEGITKQIRMCFMMTGTTYANKTGLNSRDVEDIVLVRVRKIKLVEEKNR
jgi:hypothetical protein